MQSILQTTKSFTKKFAKNLVPETTEKPLLPENQRFIEAWEYLKSFENFSSDADFLRYLGVKSLTAISEVRSGRKPSRKLVELLKREYGLNEAFLRKGDLPMLTKTVTKIIADKSTYTALPNEAFDLGSHHDEDPKEEVRGKKVINLGNGYYHMYIPMVQAAAYGSYIMEYSDENWAAEVLPTYGFTVDHVPGGTYRAFTVRGSSMDNDSKEAISEGDVLLARVLPRDKYVDQKLHLHKFKDWVIVHREGIWVKRIKEHNVDKREITIESLNPNKDIREYQDRTIGLEDVLQLLNIVQVSRKR